MLVRSKQNREIVDRLTETMVSIECESMWPVTWGSSRKGTATSAASARGIGGKPTTTADVKALAAGVAA